MKHEESSEVKQFLNYKNQGDKFEKSLNQEEAFLLSESSCSVKKEPSRKKNKVAPILQKPIANENENLARGSILTPKPKTTPTPGSGVRMTYSERHQAIQFQGKRKRTRKNTSSIC